MSSKSSLQPPSQEPISPPSAKVSAAKSAIISSSIKDELRKKDAAVTDADTARIKVEDRRQKLKLRGQWSEYILFWIMVSVVFNIILVTLVGTDIWSFDEWFGVAIIVQLLTQTVGLGVIAAKYLFSDLPD